MYLTPQLSINIRLRKIRNSHIQSEMPKCLKCTARACGAHSQPARAEGRRAGRSRHAGNEEEGEEYFTRIAESKDPSPPPRPSAGPAKRFSEAERGPGMPGKCATVTGGTPAHFRAGASATAVARALREKSTAVTVWSNGQTGLLPRPHRSSLEP